MILAAGRGTRLRPLTDHTPKPLLPVRGKPLIEWQLEALVRAGVKTAIINLHYLGEQIADHLGDGTRLGLALSYSRETELLETGGGIAKALPFFDGAPFWLVNGDIWSDFDFVNLPHHFDPDGRGHRARLVLTPKPDFRERGDFEYADGRVARRGDSFVYCGIAVLDPALFAHRAGEHFSFTEVMFELAAAGTLGAQVHHGTWLDIGTPEQYESVREG